MSLGNVRQKPLKEVWNDQAFRQMRQDMVAGRPVEACKVCYSAEDSGGTSLRTKSNHDFKHHLSLVGATTPDGSSDFKLRYYDVRFSNLCNLKCRMCCPELSSAIAVDQARMSQSAPPKPLNVYDDKEAFLRDFSPHVPFLEEIYFAGGEPLLIDAHYWALEELLRQNKRDIRLRYNTNFTVLGKGSWHAPDLWKEFSRIEVGASLDAEGARGEYIREGTRWERVQINRETLRNETPHADFKVAVTVGMMNLLHVPGFLRKCVAEGFTKPDGFFTNNLLFPEYYSAQILPEKFRATARQEYASLIDHMRKLGSPDWVLMNLSSVTAHMDANDRTRLLPEFFHQTDRLDAFYGKKFSQVFPEYGDLRA
jgi:MoaA/NifB/PqqE/SkfB family radical SAM enzyme